MHYTDDPLMDAARREHRLILEPVGTTKTLFGVNAELYGAGCAAGDWMDSRQYGYDAHAEGFDQHMTELQQQLHATEAESAGHDGHPDKEA
ncbi:hypothetical protein ABZ905_31950 [Streptomyces parvus]|uniref:hypothetical protein n=1 Tax=Streptomyces parvus TaxID=66428 RepID=UPI0033FDDB84